MTTDQQLEAVARAICKADGDCDCAEFCGGDMFVDFARAAIAALTIPPSADDAALVEELQFISANVSNLLNVGEALKIAADRITALSQPTADDAALVEIKAAFKAGWTASERGSDHEAFSPYPPTRCGEALELYLCSLTDRNGVTALSQPVPSEAVLEKLRRIIRTCEMSMGIMRDRRRTGGWKGAENVARQFNHIATHATEARAMLTAGENSDAS